MNETQHNLNSIPAEQSISVEALFQKHLAPDELNEIIRDVVYDSAYVKSKTQLFNWLQGSFQYLIGHEVALFATRPDTQTNYHFDYLTCSRYFTDDHLKEVTTIDSGIVCRAISHWHQVKIPVFVVNTQEDNCFDYSTMQVSEEDFSASELKEFVVHGMDEQGLIFILGRLQNKPRIGIAKNLQMLMPYLQRVIAGVALHVDKQARSVNYGAKKLSRREADVIQWLQLGKSNWEISTILAISPLTVKNHVQNIIKKLGVKNRRQAAAKGLRLGLIKK